VEKIIGVNERGYRIGEEHPKATLTDAEVELLRKLNEAGLCYRELAEKFETNKGTVAKICRYERRCQYAVKFKKLSP
jgi:hypothetical protein